MAKFYQAKDIYYWIKVILLFPHFWFIEGTIFFLRLFRNVTIYAEQAAAFTLNIRFFFVPLFGDYSLLGRVMGIIFRTLRIGFGLIFIPFVSSIVLFLFFFWLLIPFYLLTQVRSGYLLLLVLWVSYFFDKLDRPFSEIAGPYRAGVDFYDVSSPQTRKILVSAKNAEDIFELLVKKVGISDFLTRWGYLPNFPREKLGKLSADGVYKTAYDEAYHMGSRFLWPEHIFTALTKIIKYHHEEAHEILNWQRRMRTWTRPPLIWSKHYEPGPLGGVNRGWTGRVTPTLDLYSVDLTLLAAKGRLPLALGREKTIAQAIRILGRKGKANVLLAGPAGVGKSSLVSGVARQIFLGTQEKALFGKRVVSLDIGALVAGAQTQGELAERLKRILGEIEGSGGIILFIDQAHNLVAAGGGEVEASLVLNTLRPHLQTGKIQLIGATTWSDYRKYLAPNEAFSRLFEVVEVPEADEGQTIQILEYNAISFEKEYKVMITFPALKSAYEMSKRFIYERVLPDKAIGLLEEAVILRNSQKGKIVDENAIAEIVETKTHMPITQITKEQAKTLLGLEEKIHERLIDQEEAVSAVSNALRRARAGLGEKEKPIAAFLFVGPTGVGKTELAKTLAFLYYTVESAMLRLDMSEFQEQRSVYRLIGSPPGMGVMEPGQLTEAVRKRPFSLVLLDEFEKMHPQILTLFLQVFDDGRLTDSRGNTVDFTNTILIATSNAGTPLIQRELEAGKTIEEIEPLLLEELKKYFAPELLNRFDGIIVFKPLTSSDVKKIVSLKLKSLVKDLARKEIKVSFTDGFVGELAREGFSPQWGARPLVRLIQDKVEAKLARMILAGNLQANQEIILDESFLR